MRMKRNKLLYSLALASIVASCAKTDLPHFGGENDPNAVTISPSVALVSTRSNPLGDETAQEKFNPGDVITIKDNADNEVYTYELESGGKWKPTDGKYLLWHDETLNISASYGNSDITKVKDQSTAAGIAAADYMTFIGSVTRKPGSNELSFNMDRRRYLVIVIIDSYGDQYHHDDKVSGLKLSFEESGSSVGINPYVRDVAGNNVTTEGTAGTESTLGYSYSAICDVEYKTIKISYEVAGDNREAVLSGFGGPDPGYSYTIKLRVGKDKIEAGDVTVNGWTDADAWDDVTATKIPYLTFSAESEQKFKMDFHPNEERGPFDLVVGEYFEYSVGGGEWIPFYSTVSDIAFGGNKGDLRLRGKSSKGTALSFQNAYSTISFGEDVPVNCTGDIRTLIDYTAYSTVETVNARFCYLFNGCTQLTSAPELPAKKLASSCYYQMFYGCPKLETAPELPATSLKSYCYYGMFSGCTSLTEAPELKAETLADHCYEYMFYNCTLLETAPELPAMTLATNCYAYMFCGCTALTSAPKLPATTLKDYCYVSMFHGCTSLTEAPELKAETLALYCYSSMFYDCTKLETAPALPATKLENNCYSSMFYGCTKLETAPELPATELEDFCYKNMFSNCSLLTTAPELKATKLKDSCYDYMFSNCSALSRVKMLATTNFEASLSNWLDGAGTSATSRTLTVANDDVYAAMLSKGYVPELWKTADIKTSDGSPITPYVTFSADSDQMFKMTFYLYFTLGEGEYFEYSVGGGEWTRFTTTTVSNVSFGGTLGNLRLRGKSINGTATGINDYSKISFSDADVPVECTGDIRTLIDYTAYSTANTGTAKFLSLFNGCKQLTSAPALPAETLANDCYHYMFQNCTALTSAPALPAKTLANNCYEHMFDGCTALKTAPELKATTLANSCYSHMFQGCTNLSSVTMLATDVSASICLYNWLNNAGTSATSRTLTVANKNVYDSMAANTYYLPDNWKSGSATIYYKN